MISPSDFRKGLKVVMDGHPYEIVEYQFVKPGKGVAFTTTRFKSLLGGNVIERNIRSGEKIEVANTEELETTYLYGDGEQFTFMNSESFEQVVLTEKQLGDARDFLVENITVHILLWNERAISVELPNFVELQITYCEPGVKGDTATGATKQATLTTGATINVPLFIEQGEWIRIDTRTHSYIERVRK